ncbi:MAG TPA: phosphotransferase family protein [Amycolatopsis sp.]|nr:phosphotransferase family protein [Amycolatopsis sp.]
MKSGSRSFDAPVQRARRDLVAAGETLREWLTTRLSFTDLAIHGVTTPAGAGVANETLLADAEWRESGRVRTGGFAVRVAVDDPLYRDADISVQYKMYQALADEPGIPVPAVYGYEPDPTVLGAPFFVMERISGEVPADLPYYTESGFVVDATPAQRRRLWLDAVEVLCRVNQVRTEKVPFLFRPHDGASGLEQDLAYWQRYYIWAARGREHPTLDPAAEWLSANVPDDRPTSLAWGDARVCNMIFRDFRCVSILDWDGVSLCGGESDLAWWCVMEHGGGKRPTLPGLGSYDELVDMWEERTGLHAANLRYHIAYALFRLGAILLKLNDQMVATGHLPADADIATNSEVVQQLAELLDLPAPGRIETTLPPLRRL